MLSWLSQADLREVLTVPGFAPNMRRDIATMDGGPHVPPRSPVAPSLGFSLPGRPLLERFFQEHIVDIIQNRERYHALGVAFPSAIVLHGPPGCGKTFAVDKLV